MPVKSPTTRTAVTTPKTNTTSVARPNPPTGVAKAAASLGKRADVYVAPASTVANAAGGAAAIREGYQLLRRAGIDLPPLTDEGKMTPETTDALKKFQTDNKLEVTGTFDAKSLAALKKAKPPAGVNYPEYGKMFKDGVLSTTIAVGYDETGWDLRVKKDVVSGLIKRGFTRLDVSKASDSDLKNRGLDPKTIDKNACYYVRSFEADGKQVQALVKLVDRGAPTPKQQLASSMGQDDLVIYAGHARYGSGPDFDPADSPAQNFVIGAPFEQGHVTIGTNDLKKTKLSDNYQLMMFSGCSTRHYLNELRSIPKNKTAENLDLMVSNHPLLWSSMTSNTFTLLDGVMGRQSTQGIKAKLNLINEKAGENSFSADGFKGNKYRPQVQ